MKDSHLFLNLMKGILQNRIPMFYIRIYAKRLNKVFCTDMEIEMPHSV